MSELSTASTYPPVWLSEGGCRLEDFRAVVEQSTDPADYPHATDVLRNVPIYRWAGLRVRAADAEGRRGLKTELTRALMDGPGIVVFAGAFEDHSVVGRATDAFSAMIAEQHAGGVQAGDHFAKPGANDRVWGALEKLAVRAPGVFAEYYANDVIALVCSAWLGPGYQIISDINVVNPGGAAQVAHRDYHLGFMTGEQAARFPAHVHRLSPVLTLQGAVAHCDMPVETGPTMYLPFSQRYESGYLATGLAEFTEYFDAHHVQLPLQKGDAVFFNPALFHGAGHNCSADVQRMANLLQVSSAFGRTMGTVDRTRMSEVLFPTLLRLKAQGVDDVALRNVVAASAEGYAFPTNLDRDQPIGGFAPQTQAELVWRGLQLGWEPGALRTELQAQQARRRSV